MWSTQHEEYGLWLEIVLSVRQIYSISFMFEESQRTKLCVYSQKKMHEEVHELSEDV